MRNTVLSYSTAEMKIGPSALFFFLYVIVSEFYGFHAFILWEVQHPFSAVLGFECFFHIEDPTDVTAFLTTVSFLRGRRDIIVTIWVSTSHISIYPEKLLDMKLNSDYNDGSIELELDTAVSAKHDEIIASLKRKSTDLQEVVGLITGIERKVRQVKAEISKQRLSELGLEGMLKDETLLGLIKID